MNEAPTADGGPGFLAFIAFFVLALALWFLMRNMNARMRRMSYRQQAAHRGKDDPQAAPGEVEPGRAGAGGAGSRPRRPTRTRARSRTGPCPTCRPTVRPATVLAGAEPSGAEPGSPARSAPSRAAGWDRTRSAPSPGRRRECAESGSPAGVRRARVPGSAQA